MPNHDDSQIEHYAEISAPVQAARQQLDPREPSAMGDRAERAADSENNGVTADSSASAGGPPLVIDATELARLLRISLRTLSRLIERKRLLPPILLGRQRRWHRQEVENWVAAGAPGQREWERIKIAKQQENGARVL